MYETFVYMNEESIDPELICSICHEPFNDPCCTTCDEIYCRKCITYWIQKENRSCPHCRQILSIDSLGQVPRPLKCMLDRLQVKCMICEQTELERGNFDDHIQKMCPKMAVACSAADIQCLWKGKRDQLNQHLVNCQYELMRSVIHQLTAKNQELKSRLNQSSIQSIGKQILIKQIKDKINSNRTQIYTQQSEIQKLNDRINQEKIQIIEQQNKIGQLFTQIDQQKTQIDKEKNKTQLRRNQAIQLENEIITLQNQIKKNQSQVNQHQTEIERRQNVIKQFGGRLKQMLFS